MATNQRIAHLIAIVCLSLLTVIPTVRLSYAAGAAVTVTNPSSSPVPTQNVGGGAATHVGQPVSHLVSLDCRTSANSTKPCTGPDGNPFSPPAGKALVVTDIQFFGIFQPGQGDYALVELSLQNETGFRGTLFSATIDPKGLFAGQAHLTTGLVVPPGVTISIVMTGADKFLGSGITELQGYLAPNQ